MAKKRMPAQLETRRKAQELASAAGKDWRSLDKEDRRAFLVTARSSAKPQGRVLNASTTEKAVNPWRDAAIKTATDEGKKWHEIPKEERQKYLAKARQDLQRTLGQNRTPGR